MKIYIPSEGEDVASIIKHMRASVRGNNQRIFCQHESKVYYCYSKTSLEDMEKGFKEKKSNILNPESAKLFKQVLRELGKAISLINEHGRSKVYNVPEFIAVRGSLFTLYRKFDEYAFGGRLTVSFWKKKQFTEYTI